MVVIPAADVDRHGLHVMNIEGMRRAVARLDPGPAYALTDGFPVRGLTVPALAVPKGDATVACIAAASVLAKVTRDRIMVEMHERWPEYEFASHKGYVTPVHAAALARHGPCADTGSPTSTCAASGAGRCWSRARDDDEDVLRVLAEEGA